MTNFSNPDYLKGYTDCLKSINNYITKSLKKNDTSNSSEDIVNTFNNLIVFLFLKEIKLVDFIPHSNSNFIEKLYNEITKYNDNDKN